MFVMMLKRVDNNQKDIVQNCKRYKDLSVFDTHSIGRGFPDIVVGYQGKNYLFEIKNLANGRHNAKLTSSEVKFHNEWTGQVNIVFNHQDILRIIDYKK
jgi:hypothetical protein